MITVPLTAEPPERLAAAVGSNVAKARLGYDRSIFGEAMYGKWIANYALAKEISEGLITGDVEQFGFDSEALNESGLTSDYLARFTLNVALQADVPDMQIKAVPVMHHTEDEVVVDLKIDSTLGFTPYGTFSPRYSLALPLPILWDPTLYSLDEYQELEGEGNNAPVITDSYNMGVSLIEGHHASDEKVLVRRGIAIVPNGDSAQGLFSTEFIPSLAGTNRGLYRATLTSGGEFNASSNVPLQAGSPSYPIRSEIVRNAGGKEAAFRVGGTEAPLDITDESTGLQVYSQRTADTLGINLHAMRMVPNPEYHPPASHTSGLLFGGFNEKATRGAVGLAVISDGSAGYASADRVTFDFEKDMAAPNPKGRPLIVSLRLLTADSHR